MLQNLYRTEHIVVLRGEGVCPGGGGFKKLTTPPASQNITADLLPYASSTPLPYISRRRGIVGDEFVGGGGGDCQF